MLLLALLFLIMHKPLPEPRIFLYEVPYPIGNAEISQKRVLSDYATIALCSLIKHTTLNESLDTRMPRIQLKCPDAFSKVGANERFFFVGYSIQDALLGETVRPRLENLLDHMPDVNGYRYHADGTAYDKEKNKPIAVFFQNLGFPDEIERSPQQEANGEYPCARISRSDFEKSCECLDYGRHLLANVKGEPRSPGLRTELGAG
jgi:hypothetical protein